MKLFILVLFAIGQSYVLHQQRMFSGVWRHRGQSQIRMASEDSMIKKPKVVVIGAGWAGLGAAKALSENGVAVTLIEAGNPSEPCLTPSGKTFEPGTRGFWKDYPNINALGDELNVGNIYTEFTESSFFGPQGLECTAPVFSGTQELPSPFGQVFASFDRFKRLPIIDRLSILGLFGAMADLNRNPEVFAAYDRMSAHELFLRVGVSKRLVDDFLKPTLLVGLFKPPEELSAAVTMELLYYYALAHQTSFDVRWIAKGTVQSALLDPLTAQLESNGVEFQFNTYATKLHYDKIKNAVTQVDLKNKKGQISSIDNVDGVVMALGAKGLRSVIFNSPELAKKCPELAQTAGLDGIDVCAVRLWLDKTVATDTPVGVFSKFDALRGAGGTFFMLDQLQKDNLDELWGDLEENMPSSQRGSVLACDFYNSAAIAALDNDEIVRILMEDLLPSAYPAFRQCKVLDSYVQRYPKAVSWFAPGSFSKRPPLRTSLKNVVCAGDLVKMGDREHGAKGLCQERALVSGFEAANELATNGALPLANSNKYTVLPVRDDEPQYLAAVRVNKIIQDTFLDPIGLGSFWVR